MKRLSDLLGEALNRREILRGAEAQVVLRQWNDIVGDHLARHIAPDRFDHGVLWVAASSPEWAQEIRLRRELIIGRLNRAAASPDLFTDIRVGIRPRKLALSSALAWLGGESESREPLVGA